MKQEKCPYCHASLENWLVDRSIEAVLLLVIGFVLGWGLRAIL